MFACPLKLSSFLYLLLEKHLDKWKGYKVRLWMNILSINESSVHPSDCLSSIVNLYRGPPILAHFVTPSLVLSTWTVEGCSTALYSVHWCAWWVGRHSNASPKKLWALDWRKTAPPPHSTPRDYSFARHPRGETAKYTNTKTFANQGV